MDSPWRNDFPFFTQQMNGHPIAYLDSATTSQKPEAVLAAMDQYYRYDNANAHRGIYTLAEAATEQYEQARIDIAEWMGASTKSTVFTSSATAAINLVAFAWARRELAAGDIILVSGIEHHANLVPWQQVAKATGAIVRYIEIDKDGQMDVGGAEQIFQHGGVRLLAVSHVSNVLGTAAPLETLCGLARKYGTRVLVDGAQAAAHLPVDVAALDVDFYVWTGHKVFGPTGVGILHAREELLDAMHPFMTGGHMITSVSREGAQ